MAKQFENSKLRYTTIAFLLGLVISIIMLVITIGINNLPFSIETIVNINREQPINIVLFLSPLIIITVLGYFIGSVINSINSRYERENINSQNRFNKIFNFIEKLRKTESLKDIYDFEETDKIGKSLVNLQNELDKSKLEDEERQKIETQRRWSSEGLAMFGAILREHNNNIDILANKVISELVKYIDAKQAGFYITDLSDPGNWKIREVTNFAYNRERYADKTFEWGEGLIGACIAERKTTFLKKLPDSYIEIESGLGSAKPRCLLIVPIITEEGVIHGALELASFKIYEDFEIKFVEQIAESIATTISTLKINEETAKLLMESREQAQVLKQQEDELRKTISDMKRLQENADIQSVAFRAYQDSTNRALIRAEYSNDGILQFANKRFLDLFEYKSNAEIQNEHISKFVNPENTDWFDNLKQKIIEKNKHFEGLMNHISKNGNELWIESSYIGMLNDKGQVDKLLFLGIDATDLKNQNDQLQKRIDALNNSVLNIELSPSNTIINSGNPFYKMFDYDKEDLINNTIFDIVSEAEKPHIEIILENVKETGKIYEGTFNLIKKNKDEVNLYGYVFPEYDTNNTISQISIIAYDYTQTYLANNKITELENIIEQQNKDIKETRERFNKRIEQTKEEVKDLYSEIETINIFYEKTYELLPDAVISINSENQIVFINQSVLEFWDVFEDIFTGNDIKSLLPEQEKKSNGIYLGEVFDINIQDKPLGDRKKVYFTDSKGNRVNVTMLMVEATLGLRKQLTVFLQK